MSVTTSQRLNGDQLQAQLPAGATFALNGSPPGDHLGVLTLAQPKTLNPVNTDDATLTAAVTAAAGAFVDYGANQAALVAKAGNALAANATFLGIASPTQAQAVAQVQALTRQVNALIRLALNNFGSTANT